MGDQATPHKMKKRGLDHDELAEQTKKAVCQQPQRRGNYTFGLMAMDAYSRHQKLMSDYMNYYGGKHALEKIQQELAAKAKTDANVVAEHHQFLWDEDEKELGEEDSRNWGKRMALAYYRKLFKEYAVADLSFYKENRIAMRWRTEKEVVAGKGQFSCGEIHCTSQDALKSWEVNFGYIESNEKKNALVKLRLCKSCSVKLNFHKQSKEAYCEPAKSDEFNSRKPRAVLESLLL